MKTFRFRLERALDWRKLQERIEQEHLDRLRAELRGIEEQAAQVGEQRRIGLASPNPQITETDFRAIADYQRWLGLRREQLRRAAADCREKILTQTARVLERRRQVKMIEQKKARDEAVWKAEEDRSIQREIEDLFLGRWRPFR